MKRIRAIFLAAIISAAAVGGVLPACSESNETEYEGEPQAEELTEDNDINDEEEQSEAAESKIAYANYIAVTGDGVYIRSGAGTSYAVLGVAEKNTLYALSEKCGNWYKTYYKNREAYIYSSYCTAVNLPSADDDIESVISCGCKTLGTTYVYGAARYIDANGNRLSAFTDEEFDCSSLMQYIFKFGANINLRENTRTQIFQGDSVENGDIQRGDLLFFTNDSRRYNTGTERVGHVALYLGGNYILHTASDYAKIEQISSKRWSYFIEARRMI